MHYQAADAPNAFQYHTACAGTIVLPQVSRREKMKRGLMVGQANRAGESVR